MDVSQGSSESLSENGPKFLSHHMISVLRYQGFSDHACSTVADRVQRNVITAEFDEMIDPKTGKESVPKLVNNKILAKDILTAKGLQLNSNEPVLLLEVADTAKTTPNEVHSTKSMILNALWAKGIRPVRVYARDCKTSHAPQLLVSLLNVVNTDIGGPSMIQLLDAAFHDASWKQKLILKEGYHGTELLWCDASESIQNSANLPVSATFAQPAETTSAEPVDTAPGELESRDATIPAVSEDISVPAEPAQHRNVNDPTSDVYENAPDPVEHPAMKELRERDATRPGIVHPSWSHGDEKHNLLDIITTQSSQTEGQPLSVISRGFTSTDDDFEMVETT